MSNRFFLGRVLGTVWGAVDGLRKVLHLLLMLGFLLVLLAALAIEPPRVPQAAALVLSPQGVLVDQLSGDPFERAVARARGLVMQETLLKDLIDAVRAAKEDDRIKVLVLQLDGMTDAGLSKLQELAEELRDFRSSGKRIIAAGDGYDRNQYYLAAQADEVLMHPMGWVLIDGYSRFLPYYKSALDKLYIDYNVWTVGEYKSFVEPVTRDSMSEEDKEASSAYLSALWDSYQADVTVARDMQSDALQRYADDAAQLLSRAGGDTAQLALDYGLIDELLHRDAVRDRIREAVGEADSDSDELPAVTQDEYLRSIRETAPPPAGRSKVAVVVLSGTILDGHQPPGTVGGDTAAQQIRDAANDDDVKSLVLRVDSPGGSAFASEIILREIQQFQRSGRPAVVSMGSVAASGGYWVSMSADEIWASPTTLTGSIGVGSTVPTFQRTLGQLGVTIDGVGTTALDGQLDLMRGLGEDAKQLIGETVRSTYQQFISKVAAHRDRDPADIDVVARGRVWTGQDAEQRGLVDALGDLDDAIASAAELAGLEEGAYRVEYVEPELTFAERFALQVVRLSAPVANAFGTALDLPRPVSVLLETAQEPLDFLSTLNDPRSLYAYCFCDVR